MATQVQTRRGTTAQHGTFTGAAGELTVDTDKKVVVVHDGSTAGGAPLLRENGSQNAVTTGTSTAASFIPTSSTAPTNGVYLNGANSVAISSNGAGRLFVDASGRVGIGVTPAGRFQINVATDTSLFNYSPAASVAQISALNDAGNSSRELRLDGSPLVFKVSDVEKARLTSTGLGIGDNAPDSTLTIKAAASTTPLRVSGPSSEFLRCDQSGRLLVGTSTARSTGATKIIEIEGADASGPGASFICNENSAAPAAAISLGKSRGTSAGSVTIVQNGDSLGYLTFNGADGSTMNSYAAWIKCEVDGTPGVGDMPGRLVFSTCPDGSATPVERMRIDNTGAALIGTTAYHSATSSNTKLQVTSPGGDWTASFVNSTSTAANCFGLRIAYTSAAPNTAGSSFFVCSDSSVDRARIYSNGGLANYQANNVNLSDINTKKDISPAAGTWDCIKEWEIVNYRYKDQPDDADLNLGVIAQQVAESCPEVITVFEEAKDDQPEKLGIKEQQMYWMAIKALQEAQVRIEALEAEVAALKAQ